MKSITVKSLLFGAALAASIAACVDDPDLGVNDEAIIGGFPVKSAKFDAVGSLGFDMGDGTFFPFCSATLITPKVVLTAEHCVNWISDPSQVRFLIGWNAHAPKQILPVRGFAWEQSVEGGLVGLGSDVAVVHLQAPVAGVTPLPYGEIDGSTVGRRYSGIGYGQQDSLGTSGTRLAGSMTFGGTGGKLYEHIFGSFEAFVEDGAPVFWPGVDTSDPDILAILQLIYDSNELLDVEGFFGNGHGDAQVCFGDSGGPITLLRGNQTTVTGVASWVPFADGNNGNLCGFGSTYATLNPISMDFIDYELNCALIPREGTCDGLTAVRCATHQEGGYHELRTDCGDLGLVCGIDETGELGCIDDPCEGLPEGGTCDGTVATTCSTDGPRQLLTVDCAASGDTCDFVEGAATCVDDGLPDCTHDVCVEGPALDEECGECQTNVCAADPYCCEVFWDSICTGEVPAYCGTACPTAQEPTAADFAARGIPR